MSAFLLTGLLVVFILSTALQLAFGFFFLKREEKTPAPPQPATGAYPDISVIICARNEAEQLARFLPEILNQKYDTARWEVIVVNDRSTDHSAAILSRLQQQYDRLKVVTTNPESGKDLPGKKAALHTGIREARYETVLLTDADCRPKTTRWIQSFAARKAATRKKIILGYGAYRPLSGILNKFVRWETVHTAMQYCSFARRGMSYMGVGRNLMYEKSLYFNCLNDAGFQQLYRQTVSGDDDLLIAKISTKDNTTTLICPDSHTESIPPTGWKEWWRQKSRHMTTGKYYPARIKIFLSLYAFSHALFWFCGILLLTITVFHNNLLMTLLLLFLFFWRSALCWINGHLWQRSLAERGLYYFFPLGDFGWAIYNVFLSPFIFWKGRKTWK